MTAGDPSGWLPDMGVTDFDTKLAVVVRDDLAVWQSRGAELDLVALALRAPHKAVDGVVRGLARHP